MSRIGKMPIALPKDVEVICEHSRVEVVGPKGRLNYQLPQGITLSVDAGKVQFYRQNDGRSSKALHGLARSLVANMVTGVTQGFEKRLEIVGVGFRADLEKDTLKLTLGFSHPIQFPIPSGIRIDVEKQTQLSVKGQTQLSVKGMDKQQVGTIAAAIRSIKPPEPYKGKGIRYVGEYIRKKVGKTKA